MLLRSAEVQRERSGILLAAESAAGRPDAASGEGVLRAQ